MKIIHLNRHIRRAITLLALTLTALSFHAQELADSIITSFSDSIPSSDPTPDSITGRHQISYHVGTLLVASETGSSFVHLYRNRAVPTVSIDYRYHISRNWAIGADAAVFLPGEYHIIPPKGYYLLNEEGSDCDMTAGSLMLTASYTHPIGAGFDIIPALGVGFLFYSYSLHCNCLKRLCNSCIIQ